MAFESLKQNTGEEVGRMLDRYEERAQRGLIEKSEMERAFGVVDKAIKTTKDRLKDPAVVKTLNPEDFAKLSNAWHAWGSEKLFPDADQRRELASVLIQDKGNKKKDRALEYARQIWRTEMTSSLVKILADDATKTDVEKSNTVELMMESQIVDQGEDSAYEALMVSMHLDGGAIKDKATRQQIAQQMEASPYKVTTKGDFSKCLNALGGLSRELKDERHVSRFRITVGGELLDIPKNMRESLMLKNVAFVGDRIYAQMGNGCEGNLVIIDLVPGPDPEPVVPGPKPEPGPNPGPGPEITDGNLEFAIDQILPEYSEWLYLNPRTHWFDYTDEFYKLPVARQRDLETKIQLQLNQQLTDSLNAGIDARILAETDPDKRSVLEAVKILYGASAGNPADSFKLAREKLLLAGSEGTDLMGQMDRDFERTRQSQLLAMFETVEASRHEAITDDYAVVKWFSEEDEKSQPRIDLIHEVSPLIQEIFTNYPDLKTVDDVIVKLRREPILMPANIDVFDLVKFNEYWQKFLSTDGQSLLSVPLTSNADFLRQFNEASDKKWLDLAKRMRDEGQPEQAEEILRNLILSAKDASGKTTTQVIDAGLSVDQKNDILGDIQRQVREADIHQNLEEQGYLTDQGLLNFGLMDDAGNYIDPLSGAVTTRDAAIAFLTQKVKETTIASLVQKKQLWEGADLGLLDGMPMNPLQKEALDVYKEMEGVGWFDFADTTNKFILEEIGISVALLAVTAGTVGWLGIGARATALGARGLSAIGATGRIARMANSGSRLVRGAGFALNATGRGLAFATPLAVDGFVFHNVHSVLSTPIVGEDAWNEYTTGAAHSMAMYMIFGAGNAVWNRGMQALEGRYATNMIGRAAGRAQVGSVVEAYRAGGWREMGRTLLAKQPAMFLEASAMTALTHSADGGLEEGNAMENLAKNWVIMNLLWVTPMPGRGFEPPPGGKPKQLTDSRMGQKQLTTTYPEPLESWVLPPKTPEGIREVGRGTPPTFDSYGAGRGRAPEPPPVPPVKPPVGPVQPPVGPDTSGVYTGPNGERTVIRPPFKPVETIPNDGKSYPMTKWESPQTGLQTTPQAPRDWVSTRESRVEPGSQPVVAKPEAPAPRTRMEFRFESTEKGYRAKAGDKLQVRLPDGKIAEGDVLATYPQSTEGAFKFRFKDPVNRGNREETYWADQIVARRVEVEVPVEAAPVSPEAQARQRQGERDAELARLQAESARLNDVARRLQAENPDFGRDGPRPSSSSPTPEEGPRGEL